MIRYLKAFSILIILLAGFFTVSSSHSTAVDTTPPHGITVTPAFQQVNIKANETQKPISLSVTNNRPTTQTVTLSAADFNTLNESGGLFFVGTNPTALQKKYGLAKWISLPQKQITLQPKQTVTINATILNLPDLSSGGHYGALMLATENPGQSQSKNSVALHPIASSLLFITKMGGDTHKLSLSNVSISHNLFSLPVSATLRFYNDGNTHVIPRGIVTVTGPKGKLISKGIINDNSGIVLPETFRQYYVPLQKISSSRAFGHYKIKVDFRFDGVEQFRSYQQSFYYLPLVYTLILILGFAALVVAAKKIITNKHKPESN
jgi:hypothetical protein